MTTEVCSISSTKEVAGSMDIAKIKMLFEKQGYSVEIEKFSDVNFKSEKYNNFFVLYQSSEDPNLRYKGYIEDILIGLELIGAVLIPDFYKFRAHHNKVFMEILRDVSGCSLIQNIASKNIGLQTYQDSSFTIQSNSSNNVSFLLIFSSYKF